MNIAGQFVRVDVLVQKLRRKIQIGPSSPNGEEVGR
jgi:hypothetical protein